MIALVIYPMHVQSAHWSRGLLGIKQLRKVSTCHIASRRHELKITGFLIGTNKVSQASHLLFDGICILVEMSQIAERFSGASSSSLCGVANA
jgi:hypothetical protein